MKTKMIVLAALAATAAQAEFKIDRSAMSEEYWKIWNDDVQKRIDADIEKYRKADGEFALEGVVEGTAVYLFDDAVVGHDVLLLGDNRLVLFTVFIVAEMVLEEVETNGKEPGAEPRAAELVTRSPDSHESILQEVGSQSLVLSCLTEKEAHEPPRVATIELAVSSVVVPAAHPLHQLVVRERGVWFVKQMDAHSFFPTSFSKSSM